MDKGRVIKYCDKTIEWCLYGLIFCLPFSKAGISIFIVLAVVAWVGKRIAGYRTDGLKGLIPATLMNKAIGIFVVVNLISVLFSIDFASSLESFFTKILKFVMIFLITIETINTKNRVRWLLWIIILSTLLIGADSVVQFFKGLDFLKGYAVGVGLKASFSSGNGFAVWLIIILSVLLGIELSSFRGAKHKWISILLAMLILFFISCLVLTYSRGGWLGFVIALLMIMIYIWINTSFARRILCVFIFCSFGFVFILFPHSIKNKINNITRSTYYLNSTLTTRVASVFYFNEGSIPIRINLWKESLRIIKDYPLFGSGLNTYSRVALKYKVSESGGIYPHNSYLHMAAETGLLGLASFLWVLFSFFRMGIQYLNKTKDYFVLALLAGMLGFLVHAFFDTHLYALQSVILFWFMLGFTTAVVKMRTSDISASEF